MHHDANRQMFWQQAAAGEQMVPVNVFDNGHDLVVSAPLPGLEPENIEVAVAGKTLTIRAELRGPGQERKNYLRHEWSYGRYGRQIELPYPVDVEHANASYGNGILTLTLPKSAAARSRRIELSQTGSN